jgi:hypothetical protein
MSTASSVERVVHGRGMRARGLAVAASIMAATVATLWAGAGAAGGPPARG